MKQAIEKIQVRNFGNWKRERERRTGTHLLRRRRPTEARHLSVRCLAVTSFVNATKAKQVAPGRKQRTSERLRSPAARLSKSGISTRILATRVHGTRIFGTRVPYVKNKNQHHAATQIPGTRVAGTRMFCTRVSYKKKISGTRLFCTRVPCI